MFLTDQTFYALLLNLYAKGNLEWQECTREFAQEIINEGSYTAQDKNIIGASVADNKLIWVKFAGNKPFTRIETIKNMEAWEDCKVLSFDPF